MKKVTNKENVQRMNQLRKEPPKTVNLVRVLDKFYQTKTREEKLELKPEKLEKLSFRSKELRKKLKGKPKLLQEMISFQSLLRLLIALHSHRLISILPSQSQPLEFGNSENLICKNKKLEVEEGGHLILYKINIFYNRFIKIKHFFIINH